MKSYQQSVELLLAAVQAGRDVSQHGLAAFLGLFAGLCGLAVDVAAGLAAGLYAGPDAAAGLPIVEILPKNGQFIPSGLDGFAQLQICGLGIEIFEFRYQFRVKFFLSEPCHS